MARISRWMRTGLIALGTAGAAAGAGGSLWARDQPAVPSTAAGPVLPMERALMLTSETGRPTVLVVTSRGEPGSQRLWDNLAALAQKGSDCGWSLTKLASEAEPAQARRLGVTRFPTVIVYCKGRRGLEAIGQRIQPKDAAEVLQWLAGLRLPPDFSPAADPALSRTNFLHHAQPSPQAPQPFAPASAPAAAIPASPTLALPATTPVVISTASQPIVLQQAPPTVYVAPPAPTANIVVLSPPAAAPSVSLLQPSSVATAGQPSLFLANPAPNAVAAVPAGLTVASAPMVAPAAAAQPMMIAAIPAGPIGRFLGWIGDRMSRFKYPRVITMTTTTTTAVAPSALVAAPAAQQAVFPAQPAAVPAGGGAASPSSQR